MIEELPVIGSLRLRSNFWDRRDINTATRGKGIYGEMGKISAQAYTIVKQICFPYGNVLFLSLFSLSKNCFYTC